MRHLALAASLLLAGSAAPAQLYQVGGGPLPEALQRRLDANIDMVRLGINTETLEKAGIAPVPFTEAILCVADAVRNGRTTGAVVYLNTADGENLPIGVGMRIADPEPWPAEWLTSYEIGSVTGPVAVVPFALQALDKDRLRPGDTIGNFLPEFQGTDKDAITIEMLLRHSSGLPAMDTLPMDVRTKEALLARMVDEPLRFAPGTRCEKSSSNLLVLGLIMSRLAERPIQDHAIEQLLAPAGMVNTTAGIPPVWRSSCAPGPFSQWHGRMAWGEAESPSAFVLGAEAGHGGLCTTADDLGVWSKVMLATARGEVADLMSTPTMTLALMPDDRLAGGRNMGLGWELNGFGEGSYGWTGDTGSVLWINPKAQAWAMILTNRNHPHPRPPESDEWRTRTLELLRKSVRGLGPEV